MGIREDLAWRRHLLDGYVGISEFVLDLAREEELTPQEASRWLLVNAFHRRLTAYQIDRFEWLISAYGEKEEQELVALESLTYFFEPFFDSEDIPADEVFWDRGALAEELATARISAEAAAAALSETSRTIASTPEYAPKRSLCEDCEEMERLKDTILWLERELKEALEQQDDGVESTSSSLKFKYETPLLKLVAEVQERYLGQNFSLDERDSWPSQKSVVSWLRDRNTSLSDATARAVDRIAMPFDRQK